MPALPEPNPHITGVTPYLAVRGAVEQLVIEEPDGRVGHATLGIGAGEIYLADEHPDFEDVVGPETLGGTSVTIDLEVDDVDGVIDRAVNAGATLIRPADHPESGVQAGKVRDPYGHVWLITRVIG